MTGILGGLIGSYKTGPVGDFELIERITLEDSTTQSVSFSSIPSYYKHLQVRAFVRSALTGVETVQNFEVQINDDTATKYTIHRLQAINNNLESSGGVLSTRMVLGRIVAGTDSPNHFSPVVIDIPEAFSSTKYKTFLSSSGNMSQDELMDYRTGMYLDTTPINKITFAIPNNFTLNSKISLYGIRG